MRPGTAFEYRFFDELLAGRYQTENKLGRLFLVFTFLSIVISCLGILGLTAFSIERRTKEIGLRKIAGASIADIMLLLSKTYIRWIVIAFVIAVPPAALLMNRWLQDFAYHTPLSWWIFLLSGMIAITLAILVISWLCYKTARRNPVESLKGE
jgi:putative ABC transport system permease protein